MIAVDWDDEGLAVWEASLRLAEDDLRDREQRALTEGLSAEARLEIAAEHDKVASARDTVADMQDERASGRDVAGLQRDVKGSLRDRRSRGLVDDCDPAFPDRCLAGEDRDFAAGDRADSHDDRARAHAAREHAAADRSRAAEDRERAAAQTRSLDELHAALESRRVIGQAQGLLMARHNLSTQEAFAALVRLSQAENVKLRDVAARLASSSDPVRK